MDSAVKTHGAIAGFVRFHFGTGGEVTFKPRDLGSDRGYRVRWESANRRCDLGEVESKPAPF